MGRAPICSTARCAAAQLYCGMTQDLRNFSLQKWRTQLETLLGAMPRVRTACFLMGVIVSEISPSLTTPTMRLNLWTDICCYSTAMHNERSSQQNTVEVFLNYVHFKNLEVNFTIHKPPHTVQQHLLCTPLFLVKCFFHLH